MATAAAAETATAPSTTTAVTTTTTEAPKPLPPTTTTPADKTIPESSMRALTGEEQALYDRQIRLWGVEAQRKLASSNVLFICEPTCILSQELAKNIVLAGIARLVIERPNTTTINSSLPNTTSKLRPGFLGGDDESVISSLRSMNPLVDTSLRSSDSTSSSSLNEFQVVCAIGLSQDEESKLSKRTRASKIPLLCGRVAGEVGWVFIDACNENSVSYDDAVDAKWGGEVKRGEFGWHVIRTLYTFETTHKRMPGLDQSKDSTEVESIYKKLCEERGGAHVKTDIVARAARAACFTLPPVASIVGGLWGREVIKVIAGREQPLDGYNLFFFNAASSKGSVQKLRMKRP